jgi:hypothetical protein
MNVARPKPTPKIRNAPVRSSNLMAPRRTEFALRLFFVFIEHSGTRGTKFPTQ